MDNFRIETARLLLRRWKSSDRTAFAKINADPRVMEFYPSVNTAEESEHIIVKTEAHFEKHGMGLFAVELKETSSCIGFIGLQWVPFVAHFTPAVEIGWRLSFDCWNKGLATEGAGAVLQHGFEQLDLNEIVAMTVCENIRSRRVMEKLGMTRNPDDDFDNSHPSIVGTVLAPHVLYRKSP